MSYNTSMTLEDMTDVINLELEKVVRNKVKINISNKQVQKHY
jgi:hypothetical protein